MTSTSRVGFEPEARRLTAALLVSPRHRYYVGRRSPGGYAADESRMSQSSTATTLNPDGKMFAGGACSTQDERVCEFPFVVSPSNLGSAERDIENEKTLGRAPNSGHMFHPVLLCSAGVRSYVGVAMAIAPAAIREPADQSRTYRESAVVDLWRNAHVLSEGLVAEDGRRFRVVYPGRPGGGAGPDFRDCVIETDVGERLTGDARCTLPLPPGTNTGITWTPTTTA